jgi:hypothetical protein
MQDQFFGTPRPLPRVLFCHVPTTWCGRLWVANTEEQYGAFVQGRVAHEQFCSTRHAFQVD